MNIQTQREKLLSQSIGIIFGGMRVYYLYIRDIKANKLIFLVRRDSRPLVMYIYIYVGRAYALANLWHFAYVQAVYSSASACTLD